MFDFPWRPEQASTWAVQYDLLFYFITLVVVLVAVIVFVGTTVFVMKYRRGSKANRTMKAHTGFGIELMLATPPLVFGLIVFFWSSILFAQVYNPPEDASELYVIGKQWMWHIQHPNGVRENNELHIPVGQKTRITVISQDVIHSFYIPAFRIKRDAVPGRYNTMWFEATRPGIYHLFCAEYCGTKHSQMVGYVYVMTQPEFQKWLSNTAAGTASGGGASSNPAVAGEQLYTTLGCTGCHAGTGKQGPSHVGLYNAPVELADGKTVIADDNYLRESILNPNAKIVKGYNPNVMPSYTGQVSEEQLLQLLAYLKAQGGRGVETQGQTSGAGQGAAGSGAAGNGSGASNNNSNSNTGSTTGASQNSGNTR